VYVHLAVPVIQKASPPSNETAVQFGIPIPDVWYGDDIHDVRAADGALGVPLKVTGYLDSCVHGIVLRIVVHCLQYD